MPRNQYAVSAQASFARFRELCRKRETNKAKRAGQKQLALPQYIAPAAASAAAAAQEGEAAPPEEFIPIGETAVPQ